MMGTMMMILLACGLDPLYTGPTGDTGHVAPIQIGGLEMDPGSLSFGDVAVGSSAQETVLLTNVGDVTLEIGSATITGDPSFSLVTTEILPLGLEPGDAEVLTIGFTPSGEVDHTAELELSLGALAATLPLHGTGTLAGGGEDTGGSSSTGGELSFSQDSVAFGMVYTNASATETLTLTNTGGTDLLIIDLQSSDPNFTVAASFSTPMVLSDGSQKSFDLTYAPGTVGTHAATITVTTDAAPNPDFTLSATGTGEESPCDICSGVLNVDTGSGTSGAVEITEFLACSAEQTIRFQNTGDMPLTITDVYVNNDALSSCGTFTLGWGGTKVLAPYASHSVNLKVNGTPNSGALPTCIELGQASADQNVMHIESDDLYDTDMVIELNAVLGCYI